MPSSPPFPLKSFRQIKTYWAKNRVPFYFISGTVFNLMNFDQWVRRFTFIPFIDVDDTRNRAVFCPDTQGFTMFRSSEELVKYLLGHKSVIEKIARDRRGLPESEKKSQALFLFFDSEVEEICAQLGINRCMSGHKISKMLDNKIVTTQLGNKVGVKSVPNVLAHVDSYKTLKRLAQIHHLSDALVVQTAYGDSGKTTYFIQNEDDYNHYRTYIERESQVKVMKRISCSSLAIEACATRCGTFVGPLMGELIGVPSLTPFKGGWCGNDTNPRLFSDEIRTQAQAMTVRLGNALYKKGYKGCFEVDYLIDRESGELYLGELNPRISGITALTTFSAKAPDMLPLFLFHLMEHTDVEFDLDPELFNKITRHRASLSGGGQLIYKYTGHDLKMIDSAPVSGVYQLDEKGMLILKTESTKREEAVGHNEVFLMRLMKEGEYAYKGCDLAILFVNTPLLGPKFGLTPAARRWISAVKMAYQIRPLTLEEQAIVDRYTNPGVRIKGG